MVPAFIILGIRSQIDSASLYRPATRGPTASTRTASTRTAAARSTTAAAAETAAAETAAAETAAAETAAAPTGGAHIRRNRRRWLPVRSLTVALNRARQSIAVHRNSPIANVRRPRVDDVGSGVHCLSVALP